MGHRAQNRSLVARYVIYIGILLVLASVLQVSFLSRYRIFGVVPDLMLCTVICKDALDVIQLGNRNHISDENQDTKTALNQGQHQLALNHLRKETGQEHRKQHKNKNRKSNGNI